MPATKKATTRPKRRIVSPAEKRTQLRLTVDSRFTKSYFNQLFAVLKIRKKNALAEHIIMSFKSKAAQAQLVAFYNNQWLNIPFQTIDTAFVFPLTYEIADELERIGGEILCGVNRSKAFRVMVAYFAFAHKLKSPTQSTVA
jgi:3'-phosphoadenosine 5'-phosphosulfate sulfotransferase (PAPS reductase)/FAD synthetase